MLLLLFIFRLIANINNNKKTIIISIIITVIIKKIIIQGWVPSSSGDVAGGSTNPFG